MFRSIITVVATLAVSGFVHAQDAVQWTQAEGGNGHWYQLVDTGPITWANANTQVQGTGGHLATPRSEAENSFIVSSTDNMGATQPWIGLYQAPGSVEPDGGFQWVTNEAYEWTNWDKDEPSNGGPGESEVNLWLSGSNRTLGTWNDYQGNNGDSYIIEYSADCNDDGIIDYGQILNGTHEDLNDNGVLDCCEEDNCLTPLQWEVENDGNGHWYQAVPGQITWIDARDAALAVGGDLASLEEQGEFFGLIDLILEPNRDQLFASQGWGPHVGGLEDPDTGQFMWLTGTPIDCSGLTCENGSSSQTRVQLHTYNDAVGYGYNDVGESQEPDGSQPGYLIEWSADCNDDGVVDYGQILDGTLEDLDQNGIPDCCDQGYACFPPDCNNNAIDDAIDIGNGTSQDCNANGIPDECDLANGDSEDCNSNGTPDECESLGDCDNDGTPDVCEILNGAVDANPADGIPDACQGLPLGACCYNGGCLMSTFDDCFSAGGSFAGNGIGCADANCPTTCSGDVNGDNQIGIIDLLTIIDGWGFCP